MAKRRAAVDSDDEDGYGSPQPATKRSRTADGSEDTDGEAPRATQRKANGKGKGKERATRDDASDMDEDDEDEPGMQEPDEDEEKKFEEENEERIRERLMNKTKVQGVSCVSRLCVLGVAGRLEPCVALRSILAMLGLHLDGIQGRRVCILDIRARYRQFTNKDAVWHLEWQETCPRLHQLDLLESHPFIFVTVGVPECLVLTTSCIGYRGNGYHRIHRDDPIHVPQIFDVLAGTSDQLHYWCVHPFLVRRRSS